MPDQVENIVSNCGLPVGPHNLAFIPTPTIGSQDCDLTILLKDEKSPVWDYRQIIRKGLKERYPGTEFTFQPSDLTAKILNFGAPAPIDVQVNGPDIYHNYEFARKLMDKFREIPGAADVVIQQTMRTPTMTVEGNRTFGLGVDRTLSDMADNLLMTTAGSQQVDQIYWLDQSTGMSYLINVYTPQPFINSVTSLKTVPVDSSNDTSRNDVQLLGNLTNLSVKGTPGVVTHGNIMPLIDIYVSAEERDLGAVLVDVEKVVHSLEHEKPSSAEVEIHGQAELMRDAYFELIFGLLGAIVLVYLLIVVNFQSWLDPFIIITALPGALAGIAWALFLTHTRLSEPALTGAIMCMGTGTANSILVVSYARERLQEHGDALRAAIEAGTTRFRPVLMTASAMIIGMVPMATGYSQNAPLGRAVIGGLLMATLFTLFFVPCVYAIVYSRRTAATERTGLIMKTPCRKYIVFFAILLCGLYLGYRMYDANSDAALLRDKTLEEAILTVAVVSPKPLPPTETIMLPGNIVGWYEAPIYARVTGYVKMWHKDYGDHVKAGDVLAEINTPDLDAEYRQAHADLESVRAKYRLAEVTAKRYQAMRPSHAVSEQSITIQEQNMKAQAAEVNAAEQKVKNIEAFIGFKKIVAPFDGVVIQRNINVGDLVSKEGNLSTPNAKTNLFTVAVVDKLRLFVNVPATFGPFLSPALTADVTVPQLPHRHFTFKYLTVARDSR